MWRNIIPLDSFTLTKFENKFSFKLNKVFHSFLLAHNAGIPSPGIFPTVVRERKLVRLLDFSDAKAKDGAWETNQRLRDVIGPKRIIVGVDSVGNFVCIEREHKQQRIAVWSHISGNYEECLLDIPAFLRLIGD